MDEYKSLSEDHLHFAVDPVYFLLKPLLKERRNIGIAGRSGVGKSALINAIRGLSYGDLHAAGRYPSERMEPFVFIEGELHNIILWEIPYPRMLSIVSEDCKRIGAFDRLYDNCKLQFFEIIFVVLGSGHIQDDDVTFIQSLHSHKTKFAVVSSKTDEQLDLESRESRQEICNRLKQRYARRGKSYLSWKRLSYS
ncbi:unnamed protein product [Gongylonema pulchrum]|uniref:IRG-type G domain-containing protein n=1 Tax=Gongylonema pulchrum TaxID=637853 RepID=A0A183DEG1_9BILA|nr:unnamed protein product [Gongylonema pulchrum]